MQLRPKIKTIPNGVKDDIQSGNYTKRISNEVILNGSLILSNFATWSNTYSVRTPNIDNIVKGTANTGIATSDDGNYTWLGSQLDPAGKSIYARIDSFGFQIYVEKSKISAMPHGATIEGFAEYLNQYPIRVIYQLARPKMYMSKHMY